MESFSEYSSDPDFRSPAPSPSTSRRSKSGPLEPTLVSELFVDCKLLLLFRSLDSSCTELSVGFVSNLARNSNMLMGIGIGTGIGRMIGQGTSNVFTNGDDGE